jgi:hypothetical protein
MKKAEHDAMVVARCERHGDFETLDDGLVYYWPEGSRRGAYSAAFLRAVADELDRRNAAWQATIDNDPTLATLPRPDAKGGE